MEVSAELYDNGRVTIPSAIRKLLNIKGADELLFRVEDNAFSTLTEQQLFAEACAAYKADFPQEHSAVDELISERRWGAEKEQLDCLYDSRPLKQKGEQGS